MGGTDDPSNIIELNVLDHAQAHLKLYEQYGKKEDLCAYYMLSGKSSDPIFKKLYSQISGAASAKARKNRGLTGSELFYGREVSEEEIKNNCSKGGKIQGKRNAESGHMKAIQKLADCSKAGKLGGRKTIELKKGAFGDPEERKKVASLGGKIQGKRNAESGHLKKISALSKKSKGMMWITNGHQNKMIYPDGDMPIGFFKGKTQKKNI